MRVLRMLAMLTLTIISASALTVAAVAGLQVLNQRTPATGVAPIVAPTQTVGASSTASARPTSLPSPTPSPMPSSIPSPIPSTTVDATGILIIGLGEQVQAVPPNEPFALAFDGFMSFVTAHPEDLGYAWIDPESKEMVLSATTKKGRTLVEDRAAKMEFPYRIRTVEHSYAELQRIMNDATRLVAAGVPHAELIYMLYPDERDNRIVVVIRKWSRPLVDALADRFPADALAILVDPTRYGAGTG